MEPVPLDFHGKEVKVGCMLAYATQIGHCVPALDEGEVVKIEHRPNRNNSGEWVITLRKLLKRQAFLRGVSAPGQRVTTRVFFPERTLVQEESADVYWNRVYGEPPAPLSSEELSRSPLSWPRVGPRCHLDSVYASAS